MSLKDLEEKAVEIRLHGDIQKIVETKGSVIRVSGFNKEDQKRLHIVLDSRTSTPEKIELLKFYGESPVRGGDTISAGLILDQYSEKGGRGYILYLEILKQDGSLERIDFMYNYDPSLEDTKKLGLP
jgi:hypothetical protein